MVSICHVPEAPDDSRQERWVTHHGGAYSKLQPSSFLFCLCTRKEVGVESPICLLRTREADEKLSAVARAKTSHLSTSLGWSQTAMAPCLHDLCGGCKVTRVFSPKGCRTSRGSVHGIKNKPGCSFLGVHGKPSSLALSQKGSCLPRCMVPSASSELSVLYTSYFVPLVICVPHSLHQIKIFLRASLEFVPPSNHHMHLLAIQ